MTDDSIHAGDRVKRRIAQPIEYAPTERLPNNNEIQT